MYRKMLRLILWVVLWTLPGFILAAPKGVGPFTVVTPQGKASIRLIRRDGNMVWIQRRTASGTLVEAGMPVKDIVRFEISRPGFFSAAEKARKPNVLQQAARALQSMSSKLKPYRDMPGMLVDEAVYLEGIIHERTEDWRRALACFNEIVEQPYETDITPLAQLHAGLCMVELGQADKALELLDTTLLNDDNVALVSRVYFARGKSLEARGKYEQAIMHYLYPVVFFPYVDRNEVRGLAGAMSCYLAMKDWDAAYKTYRVLQREYPEAEETAQVEIMMEAHRDKIDREKQFQIDDNTDEEQRERIEVL